MIVKIKVVNETILEKTQWLRKNAKGKYSSATIVPDETIGSGANKDEAFLVVDFTDDDVALMFKLSN